MKKLKFNADQVRRASVLLSKVGFQQESSQNLVDIFIFVAQKPIDHRTQSDINMIKQATKNIDFFVGLDSDMLFEQCCKSLQYQMVTKGQFIFKEGDIGDKFYIVISGRVQILKYNPNDPFASMHDNELAQVQTGQAFGERGMDTDVLRTASVRAMEDTHLAFLTKADFNRILVNVKIQLRRTYFEEFANQDIFREWKFQDIRAFYDRSEIKIVCMNAPVYKEGDSLDHVFIVKKGEFRVVKIVKSSTIDLNEEFQGDFEKILNSMSTPKVKTTSEFLEARYQKERYGNMFYRERRKPITIKYITAGQMFGEMELLMDNYKSRTHSVYSCSDQAEVYKIKADSFNYILEKLPTIRAQLKQLSEQKNHNFMKQLIQYEKHFNDLTDVRKDLEKNINLDFLQLGSQEQKKPALVFHKVNVTPQAARTMTHRAQLTDRGDLLIKTKRHKFQYRRRSSISQLKLPRMISTFIEPSDTFNFVGMKK